MIVIQLFVDRTKIAVNYEFKDINIGGRDLIKIENCLQFLYLMKSDLLSYVKLVDLANTEHFLT